MTTARLTNVKVFRELSEETEAFSAVLHLNGRTFQVSNRGTGGSNDYHPMPSDNDERAAGTVLQQRGLKPDGRERIDLLCADLMEEADHVKRLKRSKTLKATVVLERPYDGMADFFDTVAVYDLRTEITSENREEVLALLRSKEPQATSARIYTADGLQPPRHPIS